MPDSKKVAPMGPERIPRESRNESKDSELFQVYILELANGRLYVGSTGNLKRRLLEHQSGLGGKTTSNLKFQRLLYAESFPTRAEAIKREKQLKGWSRRKKLALTRGEMRI